MVVMMMMSVLGSMKGEQLKTDGPKMPLRVKDGDRH
jgi:hypothetical protein